MNMELRCSGCGEPIPGKPAHVTPDDRAFCAECVEIHGKDL